MTDHNRAARASVEPADITLADLTYIGGSRVFNKHRDPMLPTHRASQMPHVFSMFSMLPESEVARQRIADFINSGELDELPAILVTDVVGYFCPGR